MSKLVAEAFARTIRRWLVASLLAKTGILQFSDILVTSNDKLWRRHEDFHGVSFERLEIAQKMKWPPIQALSIILVWEWLQKVPGFNNDFGVTEVGRALAAFTHLPRRRDPTAVGGSAALGTAGARSPVHPRNVRIGCTALGKDSTFTWRTIRVQESDNAHVQLSLTFDARRRAYSYTLL